MSDPVGIETSCSSRPGSPARDAARHKFSPDAETRRVEILSVRPTQITIGQREVEEKRRRFREAIARGDRSPPCGSVPVVLGPNASVFALDRHHWLCALLAEGVAEVDVQCMDNLSHLNPASFWRTLARRGWCRPCGPDGRRLSYAAMPATILDLQDDPFRSLAGALRRKGGFEKNRAMFSEFLWADYLRGLIDPSLVARDFDRALATALELARHPGPARGGRPALHVQSV
jgi:hypothetical protein